MIGAPFVVSNELRVLAQILADWIAPATGIQKLHLFGSRVRGDHRLDSDVDVRLFPRDCNWDNVTTKWWTIQNADLFKTINSKLPGPLAMHRYDSDYADAAIQVGSEKPVLVVGRVICVRTPRKPAN
jgi:hypothetical protein